MEFIKLPKFSKKLPQYLTYDQIILLNRLYDMQMNKMEEENEKNRNKIMRYRRKLKI